MDKIKMLKLLIIITVGLLQPGCSGNQQLPEIDSEKFIADKNGCDSLRMSMLNTLESQLVQFKALHQKKIISLLGKPDVTELYDRGQRFYIYHISPGPECEETANKRIDLRIRFSALNIANEVNITRFSQSNQ